MTPALRANFTDASNTLAREVLRLFPNVQHRNKCGISQVETANGTDPNNTGRGGRGTGRGRGRGRFPSGRGRGRGNRNGRGDNSGRHNINGVDVSDPNRNFNPEEWERLRGHYDYIFTNRE